MPLQAAGEFAQVKTRLEPALQLSGQPVKRGTMAHEHIVYMMLVDSAAVAREETMIRKYVSKLEELATRDNHQPYLAVAHRAQGIAHMLAEEYEEAESRLQQSVEIFEKLESHWQTGRTWLELGKLSSLRNNNDEAKERFTKAMTSFEAIRATPDMERTKAIMREI